MVITSRMQQPIPLEYLEHRAIKDGYDDDFSSMKTSNQNNNLFSWGAGILNLLLTPMGLQTSKSFNFQATEIIHV